MTETTAGIYSWRTKTRTKSLFLYGPHKRNYIASCQIEFTAGRSAFIHSLNGDDFYKIIIHAQLRPFTAEKLTLIRAEVSDGHVELMRRALRGLATVTDIGPSKVGDGPDAIILREVEIRTLQGSEADPGPSAWAPLA